MFPRYLIGAVLLALIAYGVMEGLPLVRGPQIVLDSPAEGASVPEGLLEVSGTAYRTQALTLDGGPILTDESGKFHAFLTLPSGGAILSLTARDRFGRTDTLRRTIIVP